MDLDEGGDGSLDGDGRSSGGNGGGDSRGATDGGRSEISGKEETYVISI